jgi:superfamily II DNA or RNA helicase
MSTEVNSPAAEAVQEVQPHLVLQAFWQPRSGTVAFWVEGDRLRELRGGMHPADLGEKDLLRMLPERLDAFGEQRTLRLPLHDGTPVRTDAEKPQLNDWGRLGVSMGDSIVDSAVEWLMHLPENPLPDSVSVGVTIRWLRRVAVFAEWMMDTDGFMPGAITMEGRIYPSWQARFTAVGETYWRELLDSMPALCMASAEAGIQPRQWGLQYLDACVDHFVRQRILRRQKRFNKSTRRVMPLHRQWLGNLRNGHLGALHGQADACARFFQLTQRWNRCFRPFEYDAEWRLGFGVEPPEAENAPWPIQFFLFSVKDTDKRYSAAEIWTESDTTHVRGSGLSEMLLKQLADAAKIAPVLEDSLVKREPESALLPMMDAFDFVTATGAALQAHGYLIELPESLTKGEQELGVRLAIDAPPSEAGGSSSLLGINTLVSYDLQIAIGDATLSEDEVDLIIEEGRSLVYRNGDWYRVDVERLQATQEMRKREGRTGVASLAEAIQLGAAYQRAGGLPVLDLSINPNVSEAFGRLKAGMAFHELPTPEKFRGELRPYQRAGFSWLSFMLQNGFGACLADDMGLGKTVQVIALLQYRRSVGINGPMLVVCPMSVVGNWQQEIAKFAPEMKVHLHHGLTRCKPNELSTVAEETDVVITTYALIVRDQTGFLRTHWDLLILDEAQSIKNPSAKKHTAALSLRAHNRLCLTGTPVENRLTELWCIMEFLNPGYLGTLPAFRSSFASPIEGEGDRERAELLRRLIQPFVLRRQKSDPTVISDLPEKQEMKVFCHLTREQAALYQGVVDSAMEDLDDLSGVQRRGRILATLVKLKQICNHPAHYQGEGDNFLPKRSGKLQRLEAMLEVVMAEKEKALIFTQFRQLGDMLETFLAERFGAEVLFMHGGTPRMRREEMVSRFQRRHGPPIFVLSLKTGGFGLNLTAASHVFHFDRWWNPAVENQATDRAYRIGQTNKVQVDKLVSIGTIEERIDELLISKQALADQIVRAGETPLTELSTDKLKELFSLSVEAVQ